MREKNIPHARGDEQNVYKRFYDFLDIHNPKPDYVIRICGDNPFLEPEFINQITDYVQNTTEVLPDYIVHQDSSGRTSMGTQYGFFAEAIRYDAFMRAHNLDLTDIEKEHVTPQFYKPDNRPLQFSAHFIPMAALIDLKPYRFTVDTDNDLYVVTTIAKELPEHFSYRDVIIIALKYPDILKIMSDAVLGDKKVGR
jgi:spore coat polysaccharide biosynthesis protein SpsF (cytidylyltransferase family)